MLLFYKADKAPLKKHLTQNAPSKISHSREHLTNTMGKKSNDRQEETALKATGIVRRIDELGRVVIPKEIRRTLRIREGDPLLITFGVPEMLLFSLNSILTRVNRQII